ncbi:MAG: nuclear transport factor 2 family protein [Hyphomicrobiales bacterium]|nr:nuclear transport factor 2 family protein [Hyphomicrobiales bacterium]
MTQVAHTSDTNTEITLELLDAIGDAFNRNDIDAVMSFFADDAIFDHAAGPDVNGIRISGAKDIRAAFSGLFDTVNLVHWTTLDARIAGDKAYCEYLRVAEPKSGGRQEFHSVDVLTFRDGLIVHKDTYYKNRSS